MAYRDEEPRGGVLRRRDFLALGSLAALTPLLPRAASGSTLEGAVTAPPQAGTAAMAVPEALPLSVGYLEGSELFSNLRKLQPDLTVLTIERRGSTYTSTRHMFPSHRFPAGDPSLVGGPVRMTIHDLYPRLLPDGPAARQWPTAIDLDVMVPLLDPPAGSTARFMAWSYRRLPAEDRSARVSFVLWPDWYSDLGLVMRVTPAGAGSRPRLLQTRFTLGSDQGRPRLLKGIYLLGVAPGAWEEDLEIPEDPAQLPTEQLSVLMTIEPEALPLGPPHR